MRTLIYAVMEFLLRIFPRSWNNKDTQGAVFGFIMVAIILSLLWSLVGCTGTTVYAEYEHHSSVPDVRDGNTADQAGACVDFPVNDHRYATHMEICLHKELSDKPVFGRDPVGTVRLRQPIYRR